MEQLFEQLYSALHKKIFNLALNYLQNVQDAEEITADVFADVYRKLEQFRSEASPATWIYRIAVNKCLDAIRYRNRQKRKGFIVSIFGQSNENVEPLDIPDFQHPGIVAEKKENAAILYAAINQLQENQRTAFILVFAEEIPQKEVAEIMQLSLKAVESLLQRAKAQLRNKLENEFDRRRITKK